MPGHDQVSGGKGRAANHVFDVLSDDFFVADAVLHGANGAVLVEYARGLLDGVAGVNRFGCNYAIVTAGNLRRVIAGFQLGREIGSARQPQAGSIDCIYVVLVNVIRIHLDTIEARHVRCKQTPYGATSDNADFHVVCAFSWSIFAWT